MKRSEKIELIRGKLRWLRLPGMVEALSDVLGEAKKNNLAPADVFEAVPIASGERVEGTLGDRDGTDHYVLDLAGAPSLERLEVTPIETIL